MDNKRVSIIGLGLIGGSLAKALKEKAGISDITAVNRSPAPLRQAEKEGVVARGFDGLNSFVYNSDVIFICTPVRHTFEYIEALAGKVRPDCVISDVGSTKLGIVNRVDSMPSPPCFIGGHPMAGGEKAGYGASSPILFENAYYILTPGKSTTENALDTLIGLIKAIGGIPLVMDAGEHDRITAAISHVPHIVASALVNAVRQADSPEGKLRILAAGGFRDITRIASSSPEIWESIILSNREQVLAFLDAYRDELNEVMKAVESKDTAAIRRFFHTAREYRDSLPVGYKGLISPIYDISVDVEDKPGIIGQVAGILGNHAINIKNINVSHNRELESGCLKITLPDLESMEKAYSLLKARGYKVYKNT